MKPCLSALPMAHPNRFIRCDSGPCVRCCTNFLAALPLAGNSYILAPNRCSEACHFIMGSVCKLLEGPELEAVAPELATKLGLGLR